MKLHTKTFIVWIFLVFLTILAIYFIYGEFLFSKWPWFRGSIIISTFTCLWVYTSWFCRLSIINSVYEGTSEGDGVITVMLAIFIVPINVMLIYPGTNTLGIGSDWKMGYLIFSLTVIHGIGSYMILRGIRQYLSQVQD